MRDDERELNSGPRETAPRRRRRSREERGLPDAQARLDLATTYLQVQHALWPELAASGELPPLTEASAAALAEEFRQRFLAPDPMETILDLTLPDGATLGGAYLRYSDDNSNSRSLAQQLRNVLERAKPDGVFVPFEFVFADAAVSGTTANRRGYQAAKAAMESATGPKTLYVDELGRAARDQVETLKLGQLIVRFAKRLIGTSDGFDSSTAHSQMMLTIFAMLHQWFSEQLRAKVNRGMRDAFQQGRNIRPASFGYRLVPKTDPEGRPLFNQKGKVVKEKVIHPEQAPWVEEAFRFYAEQGWSPDRIAKLFNEKEVGGRQAWDRPAMLQLLTRTTYIGIEYEGQRRYVRDPETGKVTTEKRPKSEWQRRDVPQLRIISDELFARAAKVMQERSDAFAPTATKRKKRSRTAAYPKVLVRPVCQCGAELQLGRSSEKYASFCCPNGSKGKHDCTLKSYKTVSIVTGAILGWIRENLFTPAFVETIVAQANASLAEEATKPREDVRPLLRQIKEMKSKINRLVRIIEDAAGDRPEALVKRLKEHERTLKTLRRQYRAAKAADAPLPEPFTKEQVESELRDLESLLGEQVEVAAPLIAELTGPITVREGERVGRKGTPWIASFAFQPAAALAKAAEANGRSSAAIWQLVASDPAAAVPVELVLDKVPEYERLAPTFRDLRDGGATVMAIAAAYGKPRKFVADALQFADTGQRPQAPPRKLKGERVQRGRNQSKYTQIAAKVARLRDKEELPWKTILERLKEEGHAVSEVTARRAYDHAHRTSEPSESIIVPTGRRTCGRSKRLGRDVHATIERLLVEGELSAAAIARQVGCSPNTVHRVKRNLKRPDHEQAA